jgi:very-short-patch-repair endonuclease
LNIMAMRLSRLLEGTKAELALEDAIGALGVPYRFQFPGYRYGLRFFPDYYLPTLGVVIEVDDPSHDKKIEEDAERSRRIFEEWGARVLRVTNENALNNPHGAVQSVLREAGLWPIPKRLPKIADALPKLRKAAAKERREAKSQSRQTQRKRGKRNRFLVSPTKQTTSSLV